MLCAVRWHDYKSLFFFFLHLLPSPPLLFCVSGSDNGRLNMNRQKQERERERERERGYGKVKSQLNLALFCTRAVFIGLYTNAACLFKEIEKRLSFILGVSFLPKSLSQSVESINSTCTHSTYELASNNLRHIRTCWMNT